MGGMLSIYCIRESMAVENTNEWYIAYLFYCYVSAIMIRLLLDVVSIICYIKIVSQLIVTLLIVVAAMLG